MRYVEAIKVFLIRLIRYSCTDISHVISSSSSADRQGVRSASRNPTIDQHRRRDHEVRYHVPYNKALLSSFAELFLPTSFHYPIRSLIDVFKTQLTQVTSKSAKMAPRHDEQSCFVAPHPDALARLQAQNLKAQGGEGIGSFKASTHNVATVDRTGAVPGLNDGLIFPKNHFDHPVSVSKMTREALERKPLRGAIRSALKIRLCCWSNFILESSLS